MSLQLGFQWKPSQSLTYYNESYNNLEKGNIPAEGAITLSNTQYYGGLPYVTITGGSLYNFIHYANPGNVLDIAAMKDALGITGELDAVSTNQLLSIITNQCSGATYWAWARVTPEIDYIWTSGIVPGTTKGILPLGDFNVNAGRENNPVTNYSSQGIDTNEIWDANTDSVMYDALSRMLPGDGFVYYTTSAGHAMMAASCAYKPDGTPFVIGTDTPSADCYMYIFEQTSGWRPADANGVIYQTGSNYNGTYTPRNSHAFTSVEGKSDTSYRVKKMKFSDLKTIGAIPFTLEVFHDVSKFEDATLTQNTLDNVGILYDHTALSGAIVDCNYPISSINIAVKDGAGNLVDTLHLYRRCAASRNNTAFAFDNATYWNNYDAVEAKLAEYYGYTLDITATVGTGEDLPVATIYLSFNNIAEDMATIPVVKAADKLSAAQLRQIVLRTMSAQLTFQWTVDEAVNYTYNDGVNKDVSLVPGTVYGGLRYVSSQAGNGAPTGNPYIWIQFLYEKDGVLALDVAEAERVLGDGNLSTADEWIAAFMNQCTGTPFWAWSRVDGTLNARYSNAFLPSNGFPTVIPEPTRAYYSSDEDYVKALERWNYFVTTEKDLKRVDKFNTEGGFLTDNSLLNGEWYDAVTDKTYTEENAERIAYTRTFGRELMYKAYSLWQPADGVLYNHDAMVYRVNTVYNADGSINGTESTVILIDQAQAGGFNHNGVEYECASPGILVGTSNKLVKTFEELYLVGTLPFTMEVFLDPSKVVDAQVVYGNANTNFADGDTLTVAELLAKNVDANYPVAYVTANFTDGTAVSVYMHLAAGYANNPVGIGKMRGVTYFKSELDKHVGETVNITAQLGSGEIKHIANVTLTAE